MRVSGNYTFGKTGFGNLDFRENGFRVFSFSRKCTVIHRNRTGLPQYSPTSWNHDEAARTMQHKTNNASEGCHSCFRVVADKYHPDLFWLSEFLEEQAYTGVSGNSFSENKRIFVSLISQLVKNFLKYD